MICRLDGDIIMLHRRILCDINDLIIYISFCRQFNRVWNIYISWPLLHYCYCIYLSSLSLSARYIAGHVRYLWYYFNPCNKRMSLRLFPSIQWDSGRFILLQWCGLLKKAPLWRTARRRLYGNKNHGLLKNMCSNQIPFNFKKNHEKGYFNSNCGEPFWPPPTLAVRMELPTTECWNLRYLRFGLHKSQKFLYDFNKAFNYLTSLLYLCHTWNLLGPSHHFFFVGSLRYDQWLNIKWSISSKELCCVY